MTPATPATLLVLDTSTLRAALAVATASGALAVATPDPALRHGRALIPAIRDLLKQAGLTVADLDGFAVGLGPGSYTGLRVGLTAAKTLAYATSRPLAGLDSLEAVAQNAPPDARHIAVIAEAQRGDVYAAEFSRDAVGSPPSPITPTRVVAFADWSAGLPEGAWVLGPAAAAGRLADAIPDTARSPENPDDHWPDPRKLADYARRVWDSGRRDDPWFLEPRYLRRSAAEDQWEAKSSR